VRDSKRERLVLTTCHPLYSAAERYAVFGRLVEIELQKA
jgi:sortase (surface protein transpeptidase)